MMPETPEPPKKPRKAKTETAKAKESVSRIFEAAEAEIKKHGMSRKSAYDPVVATKICELLAEGVPLREICRMDGMPAWRNIYFWIARDDDLAAHIARAREAGYDAIAEECLEIANTPQFGEEVSNTVNEKGEKITTVKKIDMLGHRKLQIETRLKLLAKWSNKYSDRTVITGDANGAAIKTEEVGSNRLFELIKAMEMKKRLNEDA